MKLINAKKTLANYVIENGKLAVIKGGDATADGPRYIVKDKKT